MEVLFLGTGASAGIPMPFSDDKVSEYARKKGGKENRLRTSALIDGVMMIDVSPDITSCAQKYDLRLNALKYLLITHSHSDHLNAEDLAARKTFKNPNGEIETLKICATETPTEIIKAKLKEYNSAETCTFCAPKNRETFAMNQYLVTPFSVEHMVSEDCYTYLIEKDGKTFFYCTDSGELLEDTFTYFKETKKRIDVVVFDCTYAFLKENYGGHMNLTQVRKMKKRLEEIGALDKKSRVYVTHIAPSGQATHKALVKEAKKSKIKVTYDGLKIKI